jgi:hypothetical protein
VQFVAEDSNLPEKFKDFYRETSVNEGNRRQNVYVFCSVAVLTTKLTLPFQLQFQRDVGH